MGESQQTPLRSRLTVVLATLLAGCAGAESGNDFGLPQQPPPGGDDGGGDDSGGGDGGNTSGDDGGTGGVTTDVPGGPSDGGGTTGPSTTTPGVGTTGDSGGSGASGSDSSGTTTGAGSGATDTSGGTTDTTTSGSTTGGTTTASDTTTSADMTTSSDTTTTTTTTTSSDTTTTTTTTDPDCPVATLYDFESCPSGWTTGKANASGSAVTWECGDPTSYSDGPGTARTGVWATALDGDYNDEESSYLAAPSISLAECVGATVTVRFEHWYVIEDGWDGGNVQVSTNGGASWTVLTPTGQVYDDSSLSAAYDPPDNQPGFTGEGNTTWRESTVDLTPYVGQPDVRLRFIFGSDFSQVRAGWYIDTVEVQVN